MAWLARSGGRPVCTGPWPPWPQFDERTVAAVTEALRSGRWPDLLRSEAHGEP